MADRRLKSIGRSASTESTEYSISMGKSIRRKKPKPKERWLLTRKTWRYMADAGRKLIPDGAQNRPEDVPKIEAYFQEVCKKENRFLLWRKNSYPGAIGFRKKKRTSRKDGSCRKAVSADEVSLDRPERPTHLAILPTISGKFELKEEASASPTFSESEEQDNDQQLADILSKYLTLGEKDPKLLSPYRPDFNYQDLVDRLQRHLSSSRLLDYANYSSPHQHVHFQGDHHQRSLLDTLSRYYGQTGSRDKIVSDLLTDRKALEKLYFDLRKTKGFRGSRGGTGYTTSFAYGPQRKNYPTSPPHSILKGSPSASVSPPLIEVEGTGGFEPKSHSWATQTLPIPEHVLVKVEEEYKKKEKERREDEGGRDHKGGRRKSSIDNDDVSQSVSDTIKRYLRMARKKSVDIDKADRFKRVNYDRNLRNIKAKGEITKPGDDDGLNKGCQTNDDWILTYRSLKFADMYDVSDVDSRVSSSRSSVDMGTEVASPSSPPSKGGFFSNLLHGKQQHAAAGEKNTSSGPGTMQKSKSSSSVVHSGSRLMAKKIFKSRSKSQTRVAAPPFNWTPQGGCVWTNITGRQVVLNDTFLLHLSEVERKVLQKVAIAKLQALNLGVAIKIPSETSSNLPSKPKRKPYMLKRRALTTGIFDGSRKEDDKDKEANSPTGGLVFGIPLTQCVENDRLGRGLKPFRSKSEIVEDVKETIGRRQNSRASLSCLVDPPRNEKGSCESLALKNRRVGSVPGLLDALSCSSTADITATVEDESAVPNIMSECFRFLEKNGLHTLGIFRVSTSRKRIRQLRENFDCGKETSLEDDQCPHDVATLLKEYLRDLPDPLLCRDLYHAFVHTQRIRNRRLQFEALQYLIQLLPPANRDTLYALLSFLAIVARNCDDSKDEEGNAVTGNKMDSNNLATVFAPNILHCIKPGAKEGSDRPEDRIDIINIVRTLIDHYKKLFTISAELLDEVYVHMMDSHPEILDQLLTKKDAMAQADESLDELDSENSSAPWSPVSLTFDTQLEGSIEENKLTEQKKTYSREEFLHEATATTSRMRMRHRDRIKERSNRRKDRQEENALTSSAMTIFSLLRGQRDDHGKNRSSSIESSCSAHTDSDVTQIIRPCDVKERRGSYSAENVVKASLTIPVHPQVASYSIDDDIPYIEDDSSTTKQAPTAPPRRSRNYSTGSESSIASVQPITGSISLIQGYDSAIGSSTAYSSSIQNTPTSVSSSMVDNGGIHSPPSWACSPPTSPDSTSTATNYVLDEAQGQRGLVRTSRLTNIAAEASSTSQKGSGDGQKKQHGGVPALEREPKINPSISNIGSAVMRSRTAEFEKIAKTETAKIKSSTDRDKKKYVKRRYTDSRHQTTHIPDAEYLESTAAQCKSSTEKLSGAQTGPVYKRRELISSVPSK